MNRHRPWIAVLTIVLVALASGCDLIETNSQRDAKAAVKTHNRGFAFLEDGRLDDAIKEFDRAIQLEANRSISYAMRGRAYGEKRQFEKALDDVNTAIAMKVDDGFYYIIRGAVYAQMKDLENALADFTKAIELDERNGNAYARRANVYADMFCDRVDWTIPQDNESDGGRELSLQPHWGLAKKAFADFEQAVQLDPEDAETYYNIGVFYDTCTMVTTGYLFKEPDPTFRQGAFDAYSAAIRLNPKDDKAYRQRSSLWEDRRDPSIITDLSEAIRLNPNSVDALWGRANHYQWLKEYEKAIADYTSAINNHEHEPRMSLSGLYHARAYTYELIGDQTNAKADRQRSSEVVESYRQRGILTK